MTEARIRFAVSSLALLAKGWVADAVLLCDDLQQLMFAQQAGLHAFALAVFERMQVRAEAGNGAETMLSVSSSESMILPGIVTRY